jgi:hypothetical protein
MANRATEDHSRIDGFLPTYDFTGDPRTTLAIQLRQASCGGRWLLLVIDRLQQ